MADEQFGVLVGVDGSECSVHAVEWAARTAQLRGVEVELVHVVAPVVAAAGPWPELPVPDDYEQFVEHQARQVVEEAGKAAADAVAGGAPVQIGSRVVHGPIVATLVELSEQADLVVLGSRGQGAVPRAILGSVSSSLVRHAHCPVAVIHDDAGVPAVDAPVVVGVDGSPTSELATEIAFDEASRRGVELVAVHAWVDKGPLGFAPARAPITWANYQEREEAVLAERLAGWQERYPDVTVRRLVVPDQPGPRLLEAAADAQLIVVGSRGRGGFAGMLLGSVSRLVVNSAEIPVIVARPR